MTLSQNRTAKDVLGPVSTQNAVGTLWEKERFKLARLRFLLQTLHLLRNPGISGALNVFLGHRSKIVAKKDALLVMGPCTWIGVAASIQVEENGKCSSGSNFSLNECSHICCSGKLSIGDNVGINDHTIIHVHGNATIGSDTMIGAYVYITDAGHTSDRLDIPMRLQGRADASPLVIGEDVWIGTKVTIPRGVTIGRGAIIGANSVLTTDVGPYEVWGGVPARFIKMR